MSSVSKCPKCRQQVTIPEGVAAAMQVRCPLCSAEYPLSEALAAVPPALIPVGLAASPAVLPEAVETLADHEMELVTGAAVAPVAQSAGQALAAPAAQAAGAPLPLPIPTVVPAAGPAPQTAPAASAPAVAAAVLHPWEKIPDDSLDHEADEHGKGGTAVDDEAVDAAVFGGPSKPMAASAAIAPKRGETAATATAAAPAGEAKRRQSSLAKLTPAQRLKFRILGMAIAGLIGLGLAWLILHFIFRI